MFSDIQVGDKVKIVDKWIGYNHNSDGHMDKFLGSIVTIRKVEGNIYKIEEDSPCIHRHDGWLWDKSMFEYVIDKECRDFEPACDEEIESFIGIMGSF